MEFLVLHIVFALMIIKVVTRGEAVAAKLTTTAKAAVSNLYLVFLAFNVGLKLLRTREVRVTGVTTRPGRFRSRRLDRQVDDRNRTRGFDRDRRRQS